MKLAESEVFGGVIWAAVFACCSFVFGFFFYQGMKAAGFQ